MRPPQSLARIHILRIAHFLRKVSLPVKEFSLSDLNRPPGDLAEAALASPIMLGKYRRSPLV